MKLHQKILIVLPLFTLFLAMVSTFPVEAISNPSITTNYLEEDTFAASDDTYLASGSQWADNPRGSSAGLFVGYGDSDAFDLEQTRTLLQFDLSSLANKQATAPATLKLYLTFATFESSDQTMIVQMREINEQWNENEATWNSPPAYKDVVIDEQVIGTETELWIEWEIPPKIIQNWIDNPTENHGIALISPEGEIPGKHIRNFISNNYKDDTTLRPQLLVQYGDPPTATPTNTPTNTPLPTSTPTPTQGPSLNLTLEHDPNTAVEPGAEITYTINYQNDGVGVLSGVVITGHIPISTTFLEELTGGGITDGYQIVWDIGKLSEGESDKREYLVEVQGVIPTMTPTATTPANTATSTVTVPPNTATPISETPTVISTASETPTVTSTASETPTATATNTPTETATATNTPTNTPIPPIVQLESPNEISITVNTVTEDIFGLISVQKNAKILAQVGYGIDGSIPSDDWTWQEAYYNGEEPFALRYVGVITPTISGEYDFAYRFSLDNGTTWYNADLDGSQNGYQPEQAGQLTVTNAIMLNPIPLVSEAQISPEARQPALSNQGASLVITNWAEGYSNQTGLVRSNTLFNGGRKLYLPIINR